MSDQIAETRLEGLLRQSLKAEVANLPMRVTADQVMDRLTTRGAHTGFLARLRLNRFSVQLAAVMLMVVVAFGVGIWVSRPSVVGPSPLPSASPTASPPSVDLGIFEPVAGWIVYANVNGFANAAGIWAIDPVTLDPETRVRLTPDLGAPVAWSPDGSKLLIQRDLSDVALPDGLFVLNADGTEIRLGNIGNRSRSFFTTDGSQVVYDDGDDIYVVDVEGGTPELLLTGAPAWWTPSPDGTQIVYTAGGGDHSNSVWLANADSSDAHVIVSNESEKWPGHVRGFAWSPAGDRIALSLGGFIYTFAPDGTGFTEIAGADPQCDSAGECSFMLQMYGTAPYWSPDGSQITYMTGCMDGRSSCGIAIVNADGTNLRNSVRALSGPWHPGTPSRSPLPTTAAGPTPPTVASPTASQSPVAQQPSPSPSRQIARIGREVLRFTGDRSNGMGDLIAVDPETRDSRVLVEGLADIARASWSADGKWIAYKYTNGILQVIGPDGVPRQLTAAVTGERVLWGWAWSSDGARISFRDVDGQFVYDAWTGLRTEVDFGLPVSPDGTKSLYGESGGAIYSVDVRTGERSLLVQLPGENLETVDGIEWSPDGSRVAVLNDLNPGFHRLFVANADGSDIRVLADDAAVEGWDWSPDGTQIAFAESSEAELRIWVAPANGSTVTLVASQPNEDDGGDPVWSPDGSRIAFWTEPGEAFVIDADGSGGVAPLDALAYEDWRGGWYACSTCSLFGPGF